MKTVGILGGGQLGAMLAERLVARGALVRVLDPDAAAPAIARRPERATIARWDDAAAIERFARGCDVVTCEFENVPEAAAHLVERHARLLPSAHALATAQHRVREKEFLRKEGFAHAAWTAVSRAEDLPDAADRFGFPLVVKTVFGGYDGKGQRTARSRDEVAAFAAEARRGGFGDAGFVLEERIDLACEISCVVARSERGDAVAFPAFENLHRDHVLDFTLLPARVPAAIAAGAERIALAAARALGVVGLLTVEFFVARGAPRGAISAAHDGLHLLVNELAPRPHNSGHVTRAACAMDQFDALARVLLGVPLETPRLAEGRAFCMGNLLGALWRDGAPAPALAHARPGGALCDVVLYGKRDAQPRRKMGHFTVTDASADRALARAQSLRSSWEPR